MPISMDNLRRGKKYRLVNYGEEIDFQVIDIPEEGNYRIKDINTLEIYHLHDFVKYGRGKDYNLEELV